MTEFAASNGNKIRYNTTGLFVEGGSINDGDRLFPSQVAALREFFQAERDTELGRWRSKEHPEYVVYDHGDGRVRVMHDTDGNSYSFDRDSIHRFYLPNDAETAFQSVAREFFAAHPEPKPWQQAKDGEVWVLATNDLGDIAAVVDDDWFMWNKQGIPVESAQITAGRRIWPES